MDEINDNLVKAMDALAVGRAKQQLSIFCDNPEGAAYHAETATKALQVIADLLNMKDKALAAIVTNQGEK